MDKPEIHIFWKTKSLEQVQQVLINTEKKKKEKKEKKKKKGKTQGRVNFVYYY